MTASGTSSGFEPGLPGQARTLLLSVTWPLDSLRAGTYYWERVDTGAGGHG